MPALSLVVRSRQANVFVSLAPINPFFDSVIINKSLIIILPFMRELTFRYEISQSDYLAIDMY